MTAVLAAALQTMNTRRLTSDNTIALSKVRLRRKENSADVRRTNSAETVSIPKELFEVKISNDVTKALGITDERILVNIDDEKMDILLTDASVPSEKCAQIVQKFVGDLYEKATGKKIRTEQIAITPFAMLQRTICEHCFESIEGPPYKCRVCGRCFCYVHRTPETHGCSVGQEDNQTEIIKTAPQHKAKTKQNDRAKIVITRVPCG
jgi:hypothetical protein